jgi:hypothetical protein
MELDIELRVRVAELEAWFAQNKVGRARLGRGAARQMHSCRARQPLLHSALHFARSCGAG